MAQPETTLDDVLDGVCSLLTLEKMMGHQEIELDPETLRLLKAVNAPAKPVSRPAPRAQAPRPQPAPTPEPVAAPVSGGDKAKQLEAIRKRIIDSDVCPLKQSATQAVPGQGNPHADLVVIGEAPRTEEDEQGLAFVGESGDILDRLLAKANLNRDDLWIGNIVKWRPPNDRTPTIEEIQACLPFLEEQIQVIQPKVIFCLGGVAAKTLLDTTTGIMQLRGNWHEYNGIPVMPTYHPVYLQRCEGARRKKAYTEVWSDMLNVLKKLNLPAPE